MAIFDGKDNTSPRLLERVLTRLPTTALVMASEAIQTIAASEKAFRKASKAWAGVVQAAKVASDIVSEENLFRAIGSESSILFSGPV